MREWGEGREWDEWKRKEKRGRVSIKSKDRQRRSKESDDRSSHASSLGHTRPTMHRFHSTGDDHVPYFALGSSPSEN